MKTYFRRRLSPENPMSKTEDDTFEALRKPTFQQIREIATAWSCNFDDTRSLETVLNLHYWSIEEFNAGEAGRLQIKS